MFLGMRVGIPMQGAGGLWSPYSPALAALLAEASSSGLVLDFTRNIAFRSGTQSTVTGVSGWTYTRSGTRWAGGTSFAANVPRIVAGQGIRITAGATNLFLNSDVGATQNITLPASAHTLAFEGTGSITLGGTGSGTLNGTGVSNRVSLTFTPGAGSVSFTVTGTCTNVQVESGSTATDYIPAAGASATAGADAASVTFSQNAPYSVIAQIGFTGGVVDIWQSGTLVNGSGLYASATVAGAYNRTASATDALVTPGSISGGQTVRVAGRFATNDVNAATNGALGTADTAVTGQNISSFTIGSGTFAGNPINGYVALLAILPRAITNTELQNATA